MTSNPTTRLLALAAKASTAEDPGELRRLLAQGHPLYCQALADVDQHTRLATLTLDDTDLADHCAQADTPWQPGTTRDEAITDLVFALFEATPAALAYTELAERAHQHYADLTN